MLCVFQDLLLSPSEGSESELSETEQLQMMLQLQFKRRKKWQKRLRHEHKVMSIMMWCGVLCVLFL